MDSKLSAMGDNSVAEAAPKPFLCIVAAHRADLLGKAARAFRVMRNVHVIMDRRVGERRRPERAESEESRARDRRRDGVDEQLRTQGFAIVPRGA
jgi:hypothetical protein